METMARLKENGKTILIASHDPIVCESPDRRPRPPHPGRPGRGGSRVIFHPLILALLVASGLTGFLVLYASVFGVQILRRWDLRSGSELQLGLERKTYLISTLLAFVFSIELLSLFLFVFTADALHTFFVGAMCAAGTLHVNGFGYPALLLKMGNFVLAGIWLILNAADIRGYDYPLTKKKYGFLLVLTPLILAETVLQTAFFLKMKPDITTSCCGSLFSSSGNSAGRRPRLPARPHHESRFGREPGADARRGPLFSAQGTRRVPAWPACPG